MELSSRRNILLRVVSRICALMLLATVPSAFAQTSSLAQVKTIYVEPLGHGKLGEEFRERVISRLKKDGHFEIVQSPQKAEAILSGAGEVWVTGHVSLSPRSPSTMRQSLYSGFLSARVTTDNKEVLWSYLVTPSKFAWGGIVHNLADSLASKLIEARQETGQPSLASPSSNTAAINLHGAGATFPAPLYQEWFQSFAAQRPNEHITYDAVGSEDGIRQLADGKVDFAASDMPLSDARMAEQGANFQHFASVLGAVVPIYNLTGVTRPLNFTPEVLAEIYLGKIKRWNDPKIRAVNRSVHLPDSEISVIHRSDGSGTTFVFSDFLSKVSAEWKDRVGSGSELKWPVGTAAEHNDGVALRVNETSNSIGYVEMVFALQHELSFGAVGNAAGEFVRADLPSVTAAASTASATMGDDFRISITNAPGAGAYPIASFTWLLLPRRGTDSSKGAALEQLVEWILTSGQKECSELGYAPLPRELVARELDALHAQNR
jgi:phosphate transport system substrate-binding protein